MIRILLLIGCLSICDVAIAQVGYFKTRKAVKSLKIAQQYINNREFILAKNQLKETISIKSDFAVAYRELGKVNLLLENYIEAVKAYEKSFDLNSMLSRAAYFECGEACFRLGQFEKANNYYQQFENMKNSRYTNKKREVELEQEHQTQLPIRQKNYEFAKEAVKFPTSEEPVNIGNAINSDKDEYLPTISGSGNLMIFTTERTYSPVDKMTGENIFISVRENEEWTPAVSISPQINTVNNEGMAKLAANERYMYFAGCQRSDSYGGCDIYEVRMKDFQIQDVRQLPGMLNSKFWDSQPSISCDGNVLFFSSSREGGYGGSDIWVSFKQPDGEWSEAENLGPTINTDGDEEAPFIAPDGYTLYFSSTGHPGMGDGDLFLSTFEKSDTGWAWSEAQNLGYPINSPFQEVGLFLKSDGLSAYFASARHEGFGGLDIYEVELPERFQPSSIVLLEGRVTDELTDEPLPNVEVEIMRSGKKWTLRTDQEGWYFTCMASKKAYSFQVNESDYEYFMDAAFLAEQNNSIAFRFDIPLIRKDVPIRKEEEEPNELSYNVYFDYDTYALDEKAQRQLEELAMRLKEEPEWEVEVIGYTDDRGNVAYNKMLSEKRAKAVVAFLSMSGVAVTNIRQEGRGAVGTEEFETEEDRELNRRVEVILRK